MKQTVLNGRRRGADAAERRERSFEAYRASVYQDETTWVAETLDAPLEKPLRYHVRGGELFSEQGDELRPIFVRSIEHYRAMTATDHTLAFQLRRAEAELAEYELMQRMTTDESLPNTLVVVSPLPRELETATADILGYNVRRRLGFIRVISRDEPGQLTMWTHSFDRSDKAGIDAMYALLGVTVDWSRDVLEQPVLQHVADPADRRLLRDRLLAAYDASLAERHTGKHFCAGREVGIEDNRDAIDFVESQTDLVRAHVDALIHAGPTSPIAARLRYDFAALMRERFAGVRRQDEAGNIADDMARAGVAAEARGDVVSGCGMSLGGVLTAQEGLVQAGYQNRWSYGSCRVCMADGMVGTCRVCLSCEIADNMGGTAALERIARAALRSQNAQQPASAEWANDGGVVAGLRLAHVIEQPPTMTIMTDDGVRTLRRESRIVLGGRKQVWIDTVTGEEADLSI